MKRERRVLQDRIEAVAVEPAAVSRRRNGFDVSRMNSRNATEIDACTASTLAFSVAGRLLPNSATAAPKIDRISTHSTIEPSWFPHAPAIL